MITCFDIGGTFIRHGYLSSDFNVIENGCSTTPKDSWPQFVDILKNAIHESSKAVSLSVAGAFDETTGRASVANIPCINGRRLQQDLELEVGLPITIINDADAFALAEATKGVGKGKSVVFAIILGSGVGGGLVANGNLVKGHSGIAGEWGHGLAAAIGSNECGSFVSNYKCACGLSGCVDTFGSARGLERIHHNLHGLNSSSKEITYAWREGDVVAEQTVELYSDLVARALSALVNIIGPDVIPVGGGLSNDPGLIKLLDSKTRHLTLARRDTPILRQGAFLGNGGLIGAGIAASNTERL